MIASYPPVVPRSEQSWEYELPVPRGIVVGIDGSPESLAALNSAALVARALRCGVHIVSVIPPFPGYRMDPGSDESKGVEELRLQLRETALHDVLRAAEAEPEWTHQVVVGRPARMITSIAEGRAAELIMMGKRAHGLMDRVLGDETVLHVMRGSGIPVLALPMELETPLSVVAATDFSPSSLRAARVALEIMGDAGKLYLAYVEPPAELFPAGFPLLDGVHHPGDLAGRLRHVVEELRAPPSIVVEPVTLDGKPEPVLLDFASRVGATLIAAGSHGHGRLERLILGSVSAGLVRNAPCGVLVTQPLV